jgi:hypothetical protein
VVWHDEASLGEAAMGEVAVGDTWWVTRGGCVGVEQRKCTIKQDGPSMPFTLIRADSRTFRGAPG